ncbi:hypothetical protein ABZ816_18740 [Actinosynnema sp. NPDC047251]|nr:hypothetical protein [Saccharothrix espanaensis]
MYARERSAIVPLVPGGLLRPTPLPTVTATPHGAVAGLRGPAA